jgi:hypothetical protein
VCVMISLLPSSLNTHCDRTEKIEDRVGVSDCIVLWR